MWALWRTGGCLPGSKDPIRRKCVQHSFFMAQSIRTFCTQEPLSGPWRASIQSVRFSRSVVSDTLQPHGLQDARLPCPSSNPGAHSNSCLSSQWCHPTMSSSVIPFASCLQSFSASESFLMSQFFASGGQSIGTSASAPVLQWIFRVDFLQDWLVWSPCSLGDSSESSPAPQFKSISYSVLSLLYGPIITSIHDYWKNHSFD